jgi:hypothetical protein
VDIPHNPRVEARVRECGSRRMGKRMNKAYAGLAGISMFGLVAAAHAGAPVQLSDRQMDAVTAGSAKAVTAFQTSTAGRNTAIQTSVGNITAESPSRSLSQTRTGVLATGDGNASVATEVVNQSAANGHSPTQIANASTAGSASGETATVQSVDVTTAISASGPSRNSSIGIADSLAHVTAFSTSGKWR